MIKALKRGLLVSRSAMSLLVIVYRVSQQEVHIRSVGYLVLHPVIFCLRSDYLCFLIIFLTTRWYLLWQRFPWSGVVQVL
ncbi:MAG: hypothetical protein V8S98_07290 [Lachnospiraceae bacterium]